MKYIALVGRKRSGKTTAAEYLESNYNAQCLAFADPLRDSLSVMLGDWFDYEEGKDKPTSMLQVSARELMISTANLMKQKLGDNIFIDLLSKRAMQLRNDSMVVVSDVRFQNEVDFLYVECATFIVIHKGSDEKGEDISESLDLNSLPGTVYHVYNDGSLEDFYRSLDTIICKLT